jgi:hypothetical protein
VVEDSVKINFPGRVQECEVCSDWVVLSSGQEPFTACPYCGATQTPEGIGHASLKGQVRSKGDEVNADDVVLITLRLQQFRIKNGIRPSHGSKPAVVLTVPSARGDDGDSYPSPDGDFSPTLKDYLKDHVLIGNVVLVAVDVVFAALGWLSTSTATVLGLLTGIVATGTIVDTWVHKFFH